jgi:hypothetical protein
VQTRHRAPGPFTDEQTYLYIVAVRDSHPNPRVTSAPFPFADPDAPYTVAFADDAITVTGANGTTVTYPETLYRLS